MGLETDYVEEYENQKERDPRITRICPLTFLLESGTIHRGKYCIKNECAFWCIKQNKCAILMIATALGNINQREYYKYTKEKQK